MKILQNHVFIIQTLDIFSGLTFVTAEVQLLGIGCLKCKNLLVSMLKDPMTRQRISCNKCGAFLNKETLNYLPDPLFYKDNILTYDNTINWYFKFIWSKEAIQTIEAKLTIHQPIDIDIYNKLKDIYETTYS